MRTKRDGTRGRRGFALMYSAIALVVLTVFCGLAVDATVLFLCRAKLSAAVDAAVLAGARSVILTETPAAAQTQALTVAESFFSANFPSGYLGSQAFTMPAVGSSNTNYTPTFNWNSTTGIITVSVTAQIQAPVYFMRILGFQNMTVSASGSSQRRGLVMMLVLDISSSMGTRGSAGNSCDPMVAAAQSFVNSFSPTDYIGLITFNLTAYLKDAPTTNHAQVYADIGNIQCGSNTNTITALEMAYGQIKAANQPLALNTIVLFTDGSPNGVTATFRARTGADTRYGPQLNPPNYPNACGDTNVAADNNNPNENPGCNMPVLCTNANDKMFGTIAQWGGQNSYGATTIGLEQPADYGTFAATSADNTLTLPTSCGASQGDLNNGAENANDSYLRQYAAYIPDTDFYGNSLHGVVATGAGPTVVNGKVTRDTWLYQVNQECSPDPTVQPNCKNVGDFWSNNPAIGTLSNFFTAGPYSGYFRPDQPNSIVAASMNGVMSAAYTIRADTTYNPVINTIYLTGNSTDSVDREFLPIVANAPQITGLPYDAASFTPYTNPAYQSTQASGKYLVTSNNTALGSLFAQLASELLHLTH